MITSVIYVVYRDYYISHFSPLLDGYIMTSKRQPYANPTETMI